jgi:RNA polymerase sigma-70 factor (sigma-E family)
VSTSTGPIPVLREGWQGCAATPWSWRREAPVRIAADIPDDPATWDADTAVTALYSAHWAGLVRLATLLTGDASVAEEIVADAFVALHRRWHKLGDRGAGHAYLRTSVVNGARSALRHRGVEERHRQPGAGAPAGPEERALQSLEDARVLAALRTLPRRQQEVLVLRYYADMSEQEIARTLEVSRGAVKSHAHRGLAALRIALAPGPEMAL